MRDRSDLRHYQVDGVEHIKNIPYSAIWTKMGGGKQQPNSEPVITPAGWVPIGELMVGDTVIGSDGTPTLVTGVFPQGIHEVVNVRFTDRSSVRVGWEHLWYVQTPQQKMNGTYGKVMSTRELVNAGLKTELSGNRRNSKWHVPVVKPVQFTTKTLPIDPYILGVILGDGTIEPGGSVTVCTDREIVDNTDFNYIRDHDKSPYTVYGSLHGMREKMRGLGLNGKRSWEKFIPPDYLRGDIQQRFALLQGLLDTDGSSKENGGIEFCSTSEALADGVAELCRSLGGIARKSGPRRTKHQNGVGRESWRVNVKLSPEMEPFRLSRKLQTWVRPTKYLPTKMIDSVEVVGVEESTCISVAAEDSLYVTKDYIVTHNTATALTSVVDLIDLVEVHNVLVIAPLRVANRNWHTEAKNWEHTKNLTFYRLDPPSQVKRKPGESDVSFKERKDARRPEYVRWVKKILKSQHDVFVANVEQVAHLVSLFGKHWPFDTIIVDESSLFKNQKSNRWKAMRKVRPFINRMVQLTGTPCSLGLLNLWSQIFLLDQGQRLTRSITNYKSKWFDENKYTYKITPKENAKEEILSKISDLVHVVDEYDGLPDIVENTIQVPITDDVMKRYFELEQEYLLQLPEGEVEAPTAAALWNKLLQISNGAVYDKDRKVHHIHDLKLNTLKEVLDGTDESVIVVYSFQHDVDRILKAIKGSVVLDKQGKMIDEWRKGNIQTLLMHPRSGGHGLDGLQDAGRTLIWFGATSDLEMYDQMNARLRRSGQKNTVFSHTMTLENTLENSVLSTLKTRGNFQSAILTEIQSRRKKLKLFR